MGNYEKIERLPNDEAAQRIEKLLSKAADYYRRELKTFGCLTEQEINNSKKRVFKLIQERLTNEEKEVVFLMYGIKDGIVRDFEKTAKDLGLTTEQVEEIEKNAFIKIRPAGSYEEYVWKTVNPKIIPSKEDIETTKHVIENFLKELTELEQIVFRIFESDEEDLIVDDQSCELLDIDNKKLRKILMEVYQKIERYCSIVIKVSV